MCLYSWNVFRTGSISTTIEHRRTRFPFSLIIDGGFIADYTTWVDMKVPYIEHADSHLTKPELAILGRRRPAASYYEVLGLANATGVNLRSLKQTLKATLESATKANASIASHDHSARKNEVKGIGRAESLHYMSIHDPL